MRCPDQVALAAVLALALACDPGVADPVEPIPPDDADLQAVQAWLHAGSYLDWERYDPAPSEGMIGGARVYLSPELVASLRAGASQHPAGAAAVRELVDLEDPEHMLGWAFTHKLEAGGDPQAWFFYEVFSTEPDAAPLVAERGAPGCVGCHGDGIDYVHSRLP